MKKTLKSMVAAGSMIAAGLVTPVTVEQKVTQAAGDKVQEDKQQGAPAPVQPTTANPTASRTINPRPWRDGGNVQMTPGVRLRGFGPPPYAYRAGANVGGTPRRPAGSRKSGIRA